MCHTLLKNKKPYPAKYVNKYKSHILLPYIENIFGLLEIDL